MLPCIASSAELNVYSARKEALIKPILDKFTEQSGIQVNLVTGKADALITRMRSEGQFSPADVLVSTDVGRLERAKSMQLTTAYDSAVTANVPAKLQDIDGQWVALTQRARPIMYAKDRVKPEQLSSMLSLSEPQWKGRICIRSSNNIYNQSMLAAMIEVHGYDKTLEWAKGLVKNFARSPKGGDRDQIKAVAAGECDIAIANTYYLAGMLHSEDETEQQAANKVSVFWPDQNGSGVHVNISGIAIAKHAKNVAQANQLIAFMLSNEAQSWYAKTNHEYPVINAVTWSETLRNMGTFTSQNVSLASIGQGNAEALKLMDKAGWR